MAPPIKNPFYRPLMTACGVLLTTLLVYLAGWAYMPIPGQPNQPEKPILIAWVDRQILWLLPVELLIAGVLAALAIALDRFFDPPDPSAI